MDTLASEYGWTADYILYSVYPADAFSLFPKIARRQLNQFVDQLEALVLTKHELKPEERQKWVNQLDRMRTGIADKPPERPFERDKFEQLREVMNGRKGPTPQRVQ